MSLVCDVLVLVFGGFFFPHLVSSVEGLGFYVSSNTNLLVNSTETQRS